MIFTYIRTHDNLYNLFTLLLSITHIWSLKTFFFNSSSTFFSISKPILVNCLSLFYTSRHFNITFNLIQQILFYLTYRKVLFTYLHVIQHILDICWVLYLNSSNTQHSTCVYVIQVMWMKPVIKVYREKEEISFFKTNRAPLK